MKSIYNLIPAILLCLLLSCITGCSKHSAPVPFEPSFLNFTYSGTPTAGYRITFTSTAPAGNSFLWNFGDSTTSTDANPVHTYTSNNYFDVSLIVNGDSSHIIKKTVCIFTDGIYLNLVAGTRTWHHVYTQGLIDSPFYNPYVKADTILTVTIVDPGRVAIGLDTLTYTGSKNSDSLMTFEHDKIYGHSYDGGTRLFFNHFTAAIDYFNAIHVSAAQADSRDDYSAP